jgi:UDP-glucose 4-epimerase
MAGRRVLITGISGQTGTEIARRLASDPEFEYVAGVDTRPPASELEGTDFIEADIRNPLITKLLPQTEVDTVVHNQIVRRPTTGTSAQAAHDINVIGSLQLLAACEKTPTLRTIVVRGSAGIYGAEPSAPQFFTEDMARLYPLRTRFQRDVAEIENYFETYSRRHPDVVTTMLRYQPAVGASIDTQVTRYLSMPVVPTYLGFDPRVQWIHERDAIDSAVAAIRNPVRGSVNVAAEGTIGLTRMVRMAGKLTVPLLPPLFGVVSSAGKRAGIFGLSPDFERLLRYGRALDTTRLTEEIGFIPRYTTVAAVEDFLRTHQGRRLAPSVRQAVTRA